LVKEEGFVVTLSEEELPKESAAKGEASDCLFDVVSSSSSFEVEDEVNPANEYLGAFVEANEMLANGLVGVAVDGLLECCILSFFFFAFTMTLRELVAVVVVVVCALFVSGTSAVVFSVLSSLCCWCLVVAKPTGLGAKDDIGG